MKFELDSEQIFGIMSEWCKKEHGWEINALQWQVEDKEFEGAVVLCGPE